MPAIDETIRAFMTALNLFWSVVNAVLWQHPQVIDQLADRGSVLMLSLWIVAVAGFSEAVGHSVVLFANRIPPWRFLLSLLISSLLFVGGYLLWMISIWAVARFLLRYDVSIEQMMRVVGLGYAPLIFGFLGLIPYFGRTLSLILYAWALLAIVSILHNTLELAQFSALFASLAGGTIVLQTRATLGRPLVKLVRRMRNVAAGRYLQLDVQRALSLHDIELSHLDSKDRH